MAQTPVIAPVPGETPVTTDAPGYQVVFQRRSAKAAALAGPPPTPAQIEALVAAAARAPDHGLLVPFRFIAIPEPARPAFGVLWEAAEVERAPGLAESERARAREKAAQGAMLLAMIARIDAAHPKIPASDQWLAAGAALQNLLLAATALGIGVAVRSGGFMHTTAMRAGLGLNAHEQLVSILALGQTSEWPPARPKPAVATLLSAWNG